MNDACSSLGEILLAERLQRVMCFENVNVDELEITKSDFATYTLVPVCFTSIIKSNKKLFLDRKRDLT